MTPGITSIAEESQQPYLISTNYPNPFNASTTITFSLPESVQTSIRIYNSTGQLLRTLFDGRLEAGINNILWDSKDENGMVISSGLYFYRIKSGSSAISGKMLLLK